MIEVLQGQDVDIIEPFPVKELPAVAGWMHCYKTIIQTDDGPQTDAEMIQVLAAHVAQHKTWGIIDKANLTKSTKVEAPIVGIVMFDKTGINNGYIHVASNRRAWGNKLSNPGLIEQAGKLIVKDLFEKDPNLSRISISVESHNKAAINLAKRLGFVQDGFFKDMIMQGGKLRSATHLGLLRSDYV